jgi:hypothetical protein
MAEDLILAKLSPEKKIALATFLQNRVRELKASMRELYEEKVTKWAMAYEARPREESRQFPFEGASNLVIPIIAIHTDTLHAQIMAAIFKTQPIIVSKILGNFGPDSDQFKDAYEEFMQFVAIEPSELDLYRVYNEGFSECIKYGTVTFKCPWEKHTRDFLIPGGDGTGKASDYQTKTIYEGPRPEKLPFNSFYYPIGAKRLEDMDIKCHKRRLLKHELEERMHTSLYDKDAVNTVLASPDRTNPEEPQKAKEETLGAKTSPSYGYKEWDIWECFVTYRYNDEAFAPRMVVSYHEKTNTILRAMYDNFDQEWFVGARMAHRDDMYPGYGFAEILWMFEEGASETYNGYRDNQTVANTRVWRVDPDSKLHQGYRIYPSAMLPAAKDEIEALAHGDVSNINLDELRLLLELAERRSGVSPPQQGMGAGGPGKKGVYSAMSTLSLLQEGNSRKDLNVSDMRDAHVRLARLISLQYGKFGSDSKHHEGRLALFGSKNKLIQKALEMIAQRKMGLPCYSSTASINKEVEKQNDMMLSQMMWRHYQAISTLLGSLQNAQTPPLVKQYFLETIMAANLLMKKILRNFGHDEVERLVPDPVKTIKAMMEQGGQNGGTGEGAGPAQRALPEGETPGEIGGGPPLAGGAGSTPIQ